ncbi:regulatory signaling modulator protein AmpE [Shigella flexneri]
MAILAARYQTPHHRLQSGIDAVLHVLDWVPVRLAGVVYAFIGHGEKALPAWFASLGDFHTSQYRFNASGAVLSGA